MNVYSQAVVHGWRMLAGLIAAITFVLAIDIAFGHSSLAFAVAIVGLIALNARMLRLNCPKCGKNLFFRGIFVVPWPNRVCGKCGTDLGETSQNR